MIEKRELGNTGIKVHPIGVGLWAIGGTTWGAANDRESLTAIDRAVELGVDFYDTADVYGQGHSETLMGQAMKGRRDKFILGTKIGWKGFDRENIISAYTSVEKVITSVEENLQRLQTDYIDLLQWHIRMQEPSMEVFLEACEKMITQGKIRAYGLSTSDLPYIKAFTRDSNTTTLQTDFSILNRTAENEIFPYCLEKGVSTIIRGGLAMGILTGKFSQSSTFSDDDFRRNWIEDPEQHKQYIKDIETVDRLKEAFPGTNLAQLAIRFTISQRGGTVMIPGARNLDQINANFGAAEKGLLTEKEQSIIDSIVPVGGGRKIWPA